jgi:hypothetical protein
MDKLYYYCRRMDETVEKSKTLLDEFQNNYKCNAGTGLRTGPLRYYLEEEYVT